MMQPLFHFLSLRRWRALLGAAALLPAAAGAVELGEVAVHSHIGQQLSADIELVDLTAEELAELQARLARPDVFTGASIAMHPALSGMNIAVIKRDKRRLLHLTTLRPIDSELLHIFFEFSGGGRQTVRTATLWLTPDPAPARSAAASAESGSGRPALAGNAVLAEQGSRAGAPPPAGTKPPAAAPQQAASSPAPQQAASRGATNQAVPPVTKPAASSITVQQAAAPAAAQQLASVTPVSAAAKASSAAPKSAAAPAAEAGATPSDAELSAALARATARRAAHAMPASPKNQADTPAAAKGTLAPVLAVPATVAAGKRGKPAGGQACSPEQLDQRLKQCLALDAQNAAIANKLNDLEGKVKVLQSALAPAAVGKAAQGAAAKVEQGAAAKTEHSPAAGQDPAAKTAHKASASGGQDAAAKAAHGASASGAAAGAKAGQLASAAASVPSAKSEQAASAEHAVAAKGAAAASDQHASASAAASAASAPAAASAKASAASAAARASKPAAPPEKPKQMTRSRLMTLIAGGTLALLAVIGTIVHFVRKRRAKLASGPLKIWQSWRKKKPEDAAPSKAEPKAEELPPEPVLTDIVEHGTA